MAATPKDPFPDTPGCLSDAELRTLLADDAAPDARISSHLEICSDCRQRLEAIAGTDNFDTTHARPVTHECGPLIEVMGSLKGDVPTGESAEGLDDGLGTILEPSDRPGFLGSFAGYDIIERIASGGMGVVYKGYDRALQRVVAIKLLAPALAASETARARFTREARAAAAINHEHVVAIHAVGEERGIPYLVMQFVSGRSLQSRLDESGPLELAEVLRIGYQATQGLAAAHAQGLVHRDVKPGNILLENSVERVKLTDFGLARAADAPGLTRAGIVAGTPEFMSPEQARGDRLDLRSDLFSLGCVLYVSSTGVSPFKADSTPATLRRICEEEPPPVTAHNPKLPTWFAQIVARLMARRPEDRFSEAPEVARLLMLALAQLQMGRAPGEVSLPFSRIKRPITPARRWALATATVTVVALAVGTAFWWHANSPTATAPFRVLAGNGEIRGFTNLIEALVARRDGDIIELNWDEAREIDPVVISNVPLHLRAGAGRHPVVVNASRDRPWLTTHAPLRIEGVELRAPRADADIAITGHPIQFSRPLMINRREPVDRTLAFEPQNQILVVFGAPVRLVNCRLVSSAIAEPGRQPVLLMRSAQAEFVNCEFFHMGGPALAWGTEDSADPPAETRLQLTNCVVMARAALYSWLSESVPARLEIQNSTILGSFVLAPHGQTTTLTTETIGSVFSVRRPISAPAGLALAAREGWKGQSNIYSPNNPNIVFEVPPRDLRSRSVPLAIGERIREKGGSGQRLTPSDFSLSAEEIQNLGRHAGAFVDCVGPGEAWHRASRAAFAGK